MHTMDKPRKLLRWAVLAILVAGAGAPPDVRAAVQEPQPAATAEEIPAAEIRVLNRLRQIVNALEVYRSRYDGYPVSLAYLGPPAEGSPSKDAADLIPASLTMGDAGEYLLAYAASEPSQDGLTAFYLLAGPREFRETPQRRFYVDQSGRVRYTLERRNATADDPVLEHPAYAEPRAREENPDAPSEVKLPSSALERSEQAALLRMKRIIQALEIYCKRYGGYPAALAYLGPPEDGPPTEKAARLLSGLLAGGSAQGYIFVYQVKSAPTPSQIDGYELKIRPQTYGGTGRVSFYADQSGTIHATAENRDPGPDDPIVE